MGLHVRGAGSSRGFRVSLRDMNNCIGKTGQGKYIDKEIMAN